MWIALFEQPAMKTNPEDLRSDRLRQKTGKSRQGFSYLRRSFGAATRQGAAPAALAGPESSRRLATPAAKRALKCARFGVAEQESDIRDSEFLIREKVAGEFAPQLLQHS